MVRLSRGGADVHERHAPAGEVNGEPIFLATPLALPTTTGG